MSSNTKGRIILRAKRARERNFPQVKTAVELRNENIKNTFKRKVEKILQPPRNTAKERLKRLRTSLNEDVKRQLGDASQSSNDSPLVNGVQASPTSSQQVKRSGVVAVNDEEQKKGQLSAEVPETAASPASQSFTSFSFILHSQKAKSLSTFSNKSEDAVQSEEMDWSDEVFLESMGETNVNYDSSLISPQIHKKCDDIYIITDTNVFIHRLDVVKQILKIRIEGSGVPIIYIPWIVLEELDNLKGDLSQNLCKRNAQIAVKFINYLFNEQNDRIRGQTMNDYNSQPHANTSQDNKIIACAIQVSEKHGNLVLLSRDINLRNKALMSNIPSCTDSDIIRYIRVRLSRYQKILDYMTNLCWQVITTCATNAYGDVWNKMSMLNKSPRSLQECVNIFKKYWSAVFRDVLMKQFQKAIEDLSKFLQRNDMSDETEKLKELGRLCVRICLYFKDVAQCKDTVENAIRYINQVKDS